MKAFLFQMESNSTRADQTYNYWKEIDDKWQEYMKQNEDNAINDSWPMLHKTFAILRQNWDAPEYWKKDNFESTKEVYERMNIELPLPVLQWEHGYCPRMRSDNLLIQNNIHNASDGDFLTRIKTAKDGSIVRSVILFRKLEVFKEEENHLIAKLYAFYCINNKQLRISGEDFGNIIINESDTTVTFRGAYEEEKNLLIKELENVNLRWDAEPKQLIPIEPGPAREEDLDIYDADFEDDDLDIEFVVIEKNHRVSNGLQKGIISVNIRSHSWKVGVNRSDTKDIKRLQVKYAMVGKTKAGDIVIQFNNNTSGVPILYTSDNYYNINSRKFVENIRSLLSITDDLVYLRIEKLSEKIDSITYKVTKQ